MGGNQKTREKKSSNSRKKKKVDKIPKEEKKKELMEEEAFKIELTEDMKTYLSTYGDDSSDEEDEVESYNILERLADYNNAEEEEPLSNLSFVIHAVAIKFLYSMPIQTKYYEIKKAALKGSFEVKKDEIEERIEQAIEKRTQNSKENRIVSIKNEVKNYIDENIDDFLKTRFIKSKLNSFFCEEPNRKIKINTVTLDNNNLLSKTLAENEGMSSFVSPAKDYYPKVYECGGDLKIDRCSDNLKLFGTGDTSFFLSFFSQLRLSNRIERRMEYNLRDDELYGEDKKYLSSKIDCYMYSKNPPFTTTVVEKCVTKSKIYKEKRTISRQEDVKFGFYEDFSLSYLKLYNNIRLTLSDFDQLTKPFCELKAEKLSKHGCNLHYLLYGTEVMRNPSTLIHTMMTLELISNRKMTWEDAFVGLKFPMSMKGAVGISRLINKKFTDYMPHKYMYDINGVTSFQDKTGKWANCEGYVDDLLKIESDLFEKWYEMKRESVKEEDEEITEEKNENENKYIFDFLEKACNEWYTGYKNLSDIPLSGEDGEGSQDLS